MYELQISKCALGASAWPEGPTSDSPGSQRDARFPSPERAGYSSGPNQKSPFQGYPIVSGPVTQGCALGYRIAPLRGCPLDANRHHNRHALSLIEVVASTMIVGLMAVAALNSLGAATRSSESLGNRAVALGLADELMSEILQTAYSDPSGTSVFGAEGAESAGPRSAFDDVDDYNGWNQSPPQYRDGTTMPDRADWRHRVTVTRVEPNDPTQNSGSDQGAKQIRVTIEYRNQVVDELVAVRTDTDN